MALGLGAEIDEFLRMGRIVALSRHDRSLAREQRRSLQHLRDFALAHSPFYRRFHQGLESPPLSELSVLAKDPPDGELRRARYRGRVRLARVRAFAAT